MRKNPSTSEHGNKRKSGRSQDGATPFESLGETHQDDADRGEKVSRPPQSDDAEEGLETSSAYTGVTKQTWSAALEMVNEAVEAMRISQDRTAELETQLEDLTSRYNEELRSFKASLSLSESRADEALARARQQEARAREAELRAERAEFAAEQAKTRANEAEEWLAQFNDAIKKAFPRRGEKT